MVSEKYRTGEFICRKNTDSLDLFMKMSRLKKNDMESDYHIKEIQRRKGNIKRSGCIFGGDGMKKLLRRIYMYFKGKEI